jgi:prevent-host-death family protein
MYTLNMDVAVSELRAHLSEWLEQAREGTEVVVTDRGVPVARLLGLDATDTLERLTVEGVIARPEQAKRPTASGRRRPSARTNMADLVSEQRR